MQRMRAVRPGRRLKNRDGVTLVLTIFFLAIMMGVAALAIDVGAMQLYRTQLQASADGAALAGAVGLGKGEQGAARDSALIYNTRNAVGDSIRTLTSSDVHPGTWSGSPATFHPTPIVDDWTEPTANAVQVTTRYPAAWIFARAFGRLFGTANFSGPQTLSATAVAVHGSVGRDTCIRPWAIPYQDLLAKIPGGFTVTHDLTTADIAAIAALGPTSAGPVNFVGVKLPPAHYANGTTVTPYQGANEYDNNIAADCPTVAARLTAISPGNPFVSINDWLDPENGLKTGKLIDGVSAYCAAFGCPHRIVAAIVDTLGSPSNCSPSCWHVKYMAEFMLTGVVAKKATGYFVTSNASGPFSPTAGIIQRNALVF